MADPKQNQKHEVIKTLKEPKKNLFTGFFFFGGNMPMSCHKTTIRCCYNTT